MKKHRSTMILMAVFFVGLSVLLYPAISNYFNSFHQSRAIASYEEGLSKLSGPDYSKNFEAAETYNEKLLASRYCFHSGEPVSKDYQSLLDVTGDGMMGYIAIKKLGVQMPIYHGTSEAVLAAGAGHLEGSSLPVGGKGTHAVLTGHRGLPTAKLFTDLDKLELGDTFTVSVLNQTLLYQVDNISIVEPKDESLLMINPNEDYLTLITCTPYGINTHRMLVRGVRTEAVEGPRIATDAIQIDPVIVAPVVAAPMLLVLLILLLTGSAGGKHKNNSKMLSAGKDGESNHESQS